MMKSLRARLLLIYTGVMILILFSAWFSITYFSGAYYQYKKTELMKEYEIVVEKNIANSIEQENGINAEELIDFSLTYSVGIIIIDSDNAVLYPNNHGFIRNNLANVEQIEEGVTVLTDEDIPMRTPLTQYSKNFKPKELNSKEQYEMLLYSKEDNYGNKIILYTPIRSLEDSIDIIKQLLYIIILIALIIVTILTYMVSRSIIKPIIEVNNIAVKMSNLDFSVKCNQQRNDEIGELSSSINTLSDKLKITIDQLKRELEKEKSTDKLRKQFIGQVSHELQTPLSIINSYIEALSDGVISNEEEVVSSYQIILDESAKISKIVRDLLDLSQLESGVFKVEAKEFDIGKLLGNLYYKYNDIMKGKKISFEYSGIERGIIVLGDPVRIEQAISNLLQNAIKYTNHNGKIKIIMENKNNQINIMVENTGPNIDEEDIDLIWESFYKNKKSKKQGVGLGLAITKQIVTLHNGEYYVRNTPDGVLFGISLRTL